MDGGPFVVLKSLVPMSMSPAACVSFEFVPCQLINTPFLSNKYVLARERSV